MSKAAFSKTKTLHQQTGSKFKEETSKVPHLDLAGAETWTLRKVVLVKDGEDQLDRSFEK
jgi:hypothetical protein